MIPKYYTFKQKYPTKDIFIEYLKIAFGVNNEIFNDNNWFNNSSKDAFDLFYKYLIGRTSKLYFIWDDNELDDRLNNFILSLWNPIYEFYRKQLVYVNQSLNLLIDKENRGNILNGKTGQASTSYSQPTSKSIDWDDELDAPTSKIGTKRDVNSSNIMADMLRVTNTNMYIFYSSMWLRVIHMFIDEKYIKLWERG